LPPEVLPLDDLGSLPEFLPLVDIGPAQPRSPAPAWPAPPAPPPAATRWADPDRVFGQALRPVDRQLALAFAELIQPDPHLAIAPDTPARRWVPAQKAYIPIAAGELVFALLEFGNGPEPLGLAVTSKGLYWKTADGTGQSAYGDIDPREVYAYSSATRKRLVL